MLEKLDGITAVRRSRGSRHGGGGACPEFLEVDDEFSQASLDRAEMGEPRRGSVEFFNDLRNLTVQICSGGRALDRRPHGIELVAQGFHSCIELGRDRSRRLEAGSFE